MFSDQALFFRQSGHGYLPNHGQQIDSQAILTGKNPSIQKLTTALVDQTATTHAASVVLDAKNGTVLGIASKSNLKNTNIALTNFPAASLVKIITAIYLLESGVRLDQETSYPARYQIAPNYQAIQTKEEPPRLTNLKNAFAYSNALAIAKFFWQLPGSAEDKLNQFLQVANRCGYNNQRLSDLKIPPPTIDDTPLRGGSESKQLLKLGRLASGFHSSYTNCLHQARLLAAITTDGKLPDVEILADKKSLLLKSEFPETSIASSNILKDLREMLAGVVSTGTAHKRAQAIFPDLAHEKIYAKTGTLIGQLPNSFYHPTYFPVIDGLKQWTVAEYQGIVVASVTCKPVEGHRGVVQELCFKTLSSICKSF